MASRRSFRRLAITRSTKLGLVLKHLTHLLTALQTFLNLPIGQHWNRKLLHSFLQFVSCERGKGSSEVDWTLKSCWRKISPLVMTGSSYWQSTAHIPTLPCWPFPQALQAFNFPKTSNQIIQMNGHQHHFPKRGQQPTMSYCAFSLNHRSRPTQDKTCSDEVILAKSNMPNRPKLVKEARFN